MDKNHFFKKCVILIMTAAMCVSITSCKKEEKKSALEEASTSASQTKALEEAKAQSKIDENAEQQSSDKKSEKKAAKEGVIGGADGTTDIRVSSDQSTAPTEYEQGTLTANTYESRYIGVKFSVPSGYAMEFTAEDVQRMNESMANSENEGQRNMKYEMAVANTEENIQVIVCVDGGKADYDEMTYLENVGKNYQNAVGAEVDTTPVYSTIAGAEYTTMKIQSKMGNILYCVRKKGEDMISFIISYPEGADNQLSEVMNAFQPY